MNESKATEPSRHTHAGAFGRLFKSGKPGIALNSSCRAVSCMEQSNRDAQQIFQSTCVAPAQFAPFAFDFYYFW